MMILNKTSAGHSGLRFALVLISLLYLSTCNAFAMGERVLILPPFLASGVKADQNYSWDRIKEIYNNSILKIDLVNTDNLVALWGGDTLRVEVFEIGEILDWGNQLEIDRAILTEIFNENGIQEYRVHSIDAWEGDLSASVNSDNLIEAIAELENKYWIFGKYPSGLDQDITLPVFLDGEKSLHDFIHDSDLYPPEALIQGISCNVNYEVIVSANGIPLDVQILNLSPKGYEFEVAVEKALWSLKYKAATYKGKAATGILRKATKIHFIK